MSQRLKALEVRTPNATGPNVILINTVAPTPDGPAPAVPVLAHVLGTKAEKGVSLRRSDDEPEAAFLTRIEAERARIHGLGMYEDD
ncbi:hypothetical protein T8T21_14130 [Limimaricola variabilis]|uniref:hypothetical protein n=1 Tax=Limimaricola variabilis TaxID=1492771 RepID=UPI002AC90909|nr:hypothetical protein [Limimaricola variabilis]WPY94229.1 hypothetical protein T8T21_14130 [Limimaricola variabilis]